MILAGGGKAERKLVSREPKVNFRPPVWKSPPLRYFKNTKNTARMRHTKAAR